MEGSTRGGETGSPTPGASEGTIAAFSGRVSASIADLSAQSSLGAQLLGGSALVLLAVAVLSGGGAANAELAWIGGGAVLVLAVGLAAVALGNLATPSLDRLSVASIVLFTGFVLWSGGSVVWSAAPDRSWDYTNRGFVYLAILGVGVLLAGSVKRAPLFVAYGLAVILAIAVAWALAGKIAPALFPDGARVARLREPVGFWNALALLTAMGVPISLWLSSWRRHPDLLRTGGVVLLYASGVALALTLSRGGAVVALVGVVGWLFLGTNRLESIVALLLAGIVSVGVLAWALDQPGLTSDLQEYDVRFAAGWKFGLIFSVGGLLVAVIAYGLSRWERRNSLSERQRTVLGRAVAIAVVIVLVVGIAAAAARVGNPVSWLDRQFEEFTNPSEVATDPTRLRSVSSYRWVWWQEAWQAFEENPIKGTGAGSFELTHRKLRENDLSVTEPHNVPLQFLSELGIVGFVLALGGLATALVTMSRRFRELGGLERAAAAALLTIVATYLVHSLVEWSWDFVALNAPLFLIVGVLIARRGSPAQQRRPSWVFGVAAIAVALIYALAAPRLAEERVDQAYAAIDRGDYEAAVDRAEEAHSLNPLSLDPFFAKASALDAIGDETSATRFLVQAVELQPENPEAWYELGVFELRVTEDFGHAFEHLDTAYSLDRHGPAGAPLDELREIFREAQERCWEERTC